MRSRSRGLSARPTADCDHGEDVIGTEQWMGNTRHEGAVFLRIEMGESGCGCGRENGSGKRKAFEYVCRSYLVDMTPGNQSRLPSSICHPTDRRKGFVIVHDKRAVSLNGACSCRGGRRDRGKARSQPGHHRQQDERRDLPGMEKSAVPPLSSCSGPSRAFSTRASLELTHLANTPWPTIADPRHEAEDDAECV